MRKTVIIGALAVCLLFVGFYEFVLPARLSADYVDRLEASGRQLQAGFKTLGKTADLAVFDNPDTTAQTAMQNLDVINADIKDIQNKLSAFEKVSDSLEQPRLTGYTSSLHGAKVQHEHAQTIILQSRDVLSQYTQLSDFLRTYYAFDASFVAYTSSVNQVINLDTLTSSTGTLNDRALQLHQSSQALAALKAPSGYEQLTASAAPMYQQASDGFSDLASGLSRNNDPLKDTGIRLIEQAVNTHDSDVDALPSELSQKAYLFQQVGELPDKIENLFSSQGG